MSLKFFLSKIKRQAPTLPDLKVIGGPVDITERVHVAFMPEGQTTPRSIDLRKSEDNRVYAVVSLIGKEAFSKVFKNEAEAKAFYDELRLQLLENAKTEAALIKAKLQQEYNESWKGAKTVYFHKGFAIKVFHADQSEPLELNVSKQFLGLVRGQCPLCKWENQIFDIRPYFNEFLETLESVFETGLAPHHDGVITRPNVPSQSGCSRCRHHPPLDIKAEASESLLKKLIKIGREEVEVTK